ncbi:MRG/MORF4L-binding protein [Drosophila grimshawi]|uniref:GH22690 n=1 Tax=Drosophila grimshawi TaxID=7222 RepID=B4JVE3_DROGR|nr:MRG/MORF4L-binding protein [Drosophila grimshawi]EDV98411.1 GH22690 [Drosophila grimshawi]
MMAKDEWSAEEELQLFHAMEGLRPVGINKHFYMSCIAERLSKSLNREMPSDLIWKHLGTMYKLKELDELECLPFPNEEREFCLPDKDYAMFVSKKTVGLNAASEDASDATPAPFMVSDNNSKATKSSAGQSANIGKEVEKKLPVKVSDLPKRPAKRTRGSMSNESISPSTTPPPMQSNKRRRI